MTHDQALQALQLALAAVPLVQQRSYPNHLPQGQVFPAIRWKLIGPTIYATICESSEQGDDLRVQIDCYVVEYAQLRALRAQVLSAIESIASMAIDRVAEFEMPFDADAREHRHTMDCVIYLSDF